MPRYALIAAATALITALATPAHAAASIVPDSGDTGWLLASTILGLATALPGLIMIFAASYGRQHMPRLLSATLLGAATATLLTFVIGYSLMFDLATDTAVSGFIGGGTHVMLNLMGTLREGTTVAETAFVAFQLGFVLIATTLLSGALAPRARPGWLLGFTAIWYLLVLVPITRWIWGGGWLSGFGAIDTAGGLTIFTATAISALVATAMVGTPDNTPPSVEPGLYAGGAAMLFLGLLALGGGATLGAGDNTAVAMLSLLASAAAAVLTLALFRRALGADTIATGLIAGTMAMMTAGDGFSVGGSMLTGVLAAGAAAIAPRLMPKRLAWHDSGAVIATIVTTSLTGAVLSAVFLAFAPFGGSGFPEGMGMTDQLVAQIVAIGAIALWSVIGTAIAALMMGMVLPMRATPITRAQGSGLDQSH